MPEGYCDRCEVRRAHFFVHPETLLTGISGLLLLIGLSVQFTSPNPRLLGLDSAALFYLASVVAGGVYVAKHGWEALRERRLGINLLMTMAIVGAVTIGEYVEAASLAFLFSLAELLEGYTVERARNSLRELIELAPNEARVLHDGEELTLPVEEVRLGDVIAVRPGERLPLDGRVVKGASAVNEAPITGESLPADKHEGDEVFAGSINQEGYLEIETTKRSQETTLAKIVQLVEEAEAQKAPSERFVEQFGRVYTPTVVAVAAGVAVVPPLIFAAPFTEWFLRAITLLVIACPCALLISTPVSVISAITSAARHGVLIKGGKHLEAMSQINAIALDKTGTLTTGELEVTDIVPLNGHRAEDVLGGAASLERQSEHPIAQAVVRRAQDLELEVEDVEGFKSITGRGVQARLNGSMVYLGTPGLFSISQVEIPHDELIELQSEGKTTMLLGTETELMGLIAVADRVRPGAREIVRKLQQMGLEVVMITGDNEGTARAIARELGIAHYHAGLLPDEKVHEIEHLLEEYGSVAMVGDGINDAPALARATVGIAMGAAGTDTAMETADVALMADDLSKLPYLIELSRRSRGVIRENIWSAITVKLALGLGVFPGWVTLVMAVLLGDMGMSLGVTGNAMRLARVRAHDRINGG